MTCPGIDPEEFVRFVCPLLAERNVAGLGALLRGRWSAEQITGLLACGHEDARKVAAVALSLVGTRCCIDGLARLLSEPDPVVNQLAEHALWSIWLRGSTPDANHALCEGHKALNALDLDLAVLHFSRAIKLDSTFAEAWNQRALAEYLRDNWEASITDCREALRLMPCHFGAAAGLGHCLVHLGRNADAIKAYEHALRLNPHMECVAQGLEELRGNTSNRHDPDAA